MQLRETDKAYLAGIIDGEGCVTIAVSRGKYFQLKLIVTGTVHEHIKECARISGVGTVHFQARERPQADQTQWHISSSEAAKLLREVLPYLKLKDEQARLGLRFQDHMNKSPNYNNRHPMPRAVISYRLSLANLLKEMKSNGKTFEGDNLEKVLTPPETHKQMVLI